MPASFLNRHRTICAVLEEIRELNDLSVEASKHYNSRKRINDLINEAKDYAEKMSAKLQEYKDNELSRSDARSSR